MRTTSRENPVDASVQIHVGRQRDGCTYALNPHTRNRIKQAFPHAKLWSQVFVGYESEDSFEESQTNALLQVAQLLTGLTADQLRELGGVEIIDPVAGTRETVQALAS